MKKDLQETIRIIQSGKLDPVYFLNGDDFFLQNYFIDIVEKAMAKTAEPERIYMIPEPGAYDQIIREINGISLFPQPKLFVLQNPTQIKGKNREELLDYCHSPNLDNCLIIIFDKFDPQKKIIKELSKQIGVINTSPPFPERLESWVKLLLKEQGVSISQNALDRLLEFSGDSLYHVANEIQKITLGLGDRTKIVEDDVLRHVGWKRSYYPWHFLDAVGERRFNQAVLIGKSLLNHGSDISKIISLLTTLFLELLLRQLDDQRKWKKDFQEFWLSRMTKQRLPRYQKKYKKTEIQQILRALAQVDRKVKTSGSNGVFILIPLMYRIIMNYA